MEQVSIKIADIQAIQRDKELILIIDTQGDQYACLGYKIFDLARECGEISLMILRGIKGRHLVLNKGFTYWEPIKFIKHPKRGAKIG